MNCARCNFENPPGFKFCGNCGDSLSRLCPSCNYENIQRAKFCNRCGAVLANLCPNCRTDNPKFARFCSECGFQLDKVCSQCKTINPLYANYCNSCGTSLPKIVIAAAPSAHQKSAPLISFRPVIQPSKAPDIIPQQTIVEISEPEVTEQEPAVKVPDKVQVEHPEQKEQIEEKLSTAEVVAPTEDKTSDEESEVDYDKLKMLEDYIPPALREEIYKYSGKIEGERKLVTIVFSDVSGFTALSEKYADEPEEIQRIIHGCLKREIDEVYELQGIPDKVVGDEVMALFGAPITHENDVERAIIAAMAMREAVISYGDEIGTPLNVHIGINTGKVSVGSIGGQKLLNYTVIGDPVNLASRIEHIAETGEIVVGELTYQLTKAKFDFELPRSVKLKNKTGEQPIYRLIGPKEHPGSPRGIEGLTSPMAGREIEFETLMVCARKTMAGDFQITSITGEAGLGKSRLKRELKDALSNEVLWIEGQCQSHTEHVAYSIFLSAIKSQFGVTGLDTEAEIKDKITNGSMKLFGEDAKISPAEEILPYILHLMPVKLSDKQAEKIEYLKENPEELQKQTFAAIKHILMQAVKQRPIVLALEDLHWLDKVSYELILFLIDNLTETPILLLNIYRPEIYGDLGTGDRLCWKLATTAKEKFGDDKYTEVRLGRLSKENMKFILDSMLNLEDTQDSHDLKDMILNKAEGNPFYLEEVIRKLIEDVIIQPEEGGNGYIIVSNIKNIDVPVGVQAVVRARIDRVRGTPKRTLQHASVIGRIFPLRILEYISPQDNLEKDLDKLTTLELIAKLRNGSESGYNFKHILIYETAYDSIIVGRKKVLHGLVGNCLEKYYPEEVYLDQLAFHYRRSDKTDKAVNYLVKAGKKAQNLYSKADAIDYYLDAQQRIQEMSEEQSQMKMMIYGGLGDVYGLDGQFDAALDNYARLLEYFSSPESRAVIFRKMGEIYRKKGDLETAIAQYNAGLAELDGKEKSEEAARILTDIGYIYYLEAKYPEAIKIHTQALEVVEGTEHYYVQALVYKNLGNVMCERADFDRAIEYWEKSRKILERFNASTELAKLYNNFGELYMRRGENDKALSYFQKSLEEKEKLGDVDGLITSYDNYGKFYRSMGEFDKSLAFFEQGLEIAERIGNMRKIGIINNNLASMYLSWEKFEKAIEHLELCLPIFEKLNLTKGLTYALGNIGRAHGELGNLHEAIEYQNKALEMGKQLNDQYLVSSVYHNIGKVYLKNQNYDMTINYFHKALEISEEKGFSETSGEAHRDLGKTYLEKGNFEEAQMHLNKAIEFFEKLGNAAEIEKIREIITFT
ncbi:tetratricopeptide repeat protein [Candidatus Poribacteria bacterium]|nr:tetratricopeptide repeat protein [Candidatus Poribacteria bacterium]